MAHLWYPDTCRGGQCVLDIVDGHKGLNSIVQMCPHHTEMRRGLASDSDLFAAAIATNRVKNGALIDAAAELSVEMSAVDWSINTTDQVVITTGISAPRRTRLQNAINSRVGAGKVVVQ